MGEALYHIRMTIIGLAISSVGYRLLVDGDWGFQIGGVFGAAVCYLNVWRASRAATDSPAEP